MEAPVDNDFSLKLFLSADLMGSTALKSEAGGTEANPLWLGTFLSFYEEFPIIFKGEQQKLDCPTIEFWKGIGDELLWVTTLRRGGDALSTLRAFKAALETYNKRLDQYDKKVRLKGSAWLAGFPVTHKVVRLPESKGFDYIGPYIDTGFRLSKYSSRMRMVISVDLAWLILNCRALPAELKDLPLRFDDSESMKGVLGGRPYPIIWIECHSPLESKEYNLRRGSAPDKDWRDRLEEFCRDFIQDTDDKIIFPYILNDDVFGEAHPSYYAWLRQQDEKAKEPLETQDENGDPMDAPGPTHGPSRVLKGVRLLSEAPVTENTPRSS